MNLETIQTQIAKHCPGVKMRRIRASLLIEEAGELLKIIEFLKTSPDWQMNYLANLTATDYLDYFEVVYHLYSMTKKTGPLQLRVRTNRENPEVPSLLDVYFGSKFQEREVYDMYGIVFKDHRKLKRQFMWDEFEGFPMRKDYVQEDSEVLEIADIEWLDQHQIKIPDEMREQARKLQAEGKRALSNREGKET